MSGLLPKSRATDIEQHLDNCPHCAQLLLVEDQEFDTLLYSSWHLTSPSAGFASRVMQQVGSEKKSSWLWLAVLWSGYTSLWIVGAMLMVFRRNLTWVVGLTSDMVGFLRSMLRVLRVIAGAMQLYSISTTGLIIVFGSAAVVFLGMVYISKEEFAQ